MQLLFHGALLGDVHKHALEAEHASEEIADGEAGYEGINERTVFAPEHEFAIPHGAFFLHLADQGIALGRVIVHVPEIAGLQILLAVVAQDADEGGIGVEDAAIGGREEYALAERFEKLGEADLRFVQGGDVAGPAADGIGVILLLRHLQPAIEVAEFAIAFQAHRQHAAPEAFLEERGKGALGLRERG